MGARYPYYLLADSPEGQRKEGEVTPHARRRQTDARRHPPGLRLRARAAHHAEVDRQQCRDRRDLGEVAQTLEPLRAGSTRARRGPNAVLGARQPRARNPERRRLEATHRPSTERPSEVGRASPRAEPDDREAWTMGDPARGRGSRRASTAREWWEARIARQKEIDASIAAKAEFEYLYDKPYADNSRIRVAGPFTVESLSPHRVLAVDEDDSLIDTLDARRASEAGGDGNGLRPDGARQT